MVAAEAVLGELVHVVLAYHGVPHVLHAPAHPGLALLAVGDLGPGAAGGHDVLAEVGPGLGPDLGAHHAPEVGDEAGAELGLRRPRAERLHQAQDLNLEVADGVSGEDEDGLLALVTGPDAGAHCQERGEQSEGLHESVCLCVCVMLLGMYVMSD